ncbi:MAG: asparagine synthetase B family protein [Candidatus Thorarchaeota archaeon]
MPGLVGIASIKSIDPKLFEQMVESLRDENFYKVDKYLNSNIGLARVHLGIFNPTSQPVFNEDKTLCIFMDGKIYGYEDDLKRLEDKGHKFVERNDPEYCLHLYEELGDKFTKDLNGSFVIVIIEINQNKMIIVTDRYGHKIINYLIQNDTFYFSSKISSLFLDSSVKKELNDIAISDYFAFGKMLGTKTLFKNIEILPYASIVTFENGKLSIKKYWDFEYKPDYNKSEEDFIDEMINTFKTAMEIRFKDQYNYGIGLSGGLDSRTMVAALPDEMKEKITAYPHGEIGCYDIKIARSIAKKLRIKLNPIYISSEMFLKNPTESIQLTDGLNTIGSNYLQKVSRLMRKDNCDVVFIGIGLDTFITNPTMSRKILESKSDEEVLMNSFNGYRFFSDKELSQLFNKKYYSKVKDLPLKSFREEFFKYKDDNLANRYDHFDNCNHCMRLQPLGFVLWRTAIETVVPAFDNDFVNVTLTIPPESRFFYHLYRKFLMKLSPELAKIKSNHTLLSADAPIKLWKISLSILDRINKFKERIYRFSKGRIYFPNKHMFLNLDNYFKRNDTWKKLLKDILFNKNALYKKYINQDFVKYLVNQQLEGRANYVSKIIYLISFELFLREFIEEKR